MNCKMANKKERQAIQIFQRVPPYQNLYLLTNQFWEYLFRANILTPSQQKTKQCLV